MNSIRGRLIRALLVAWILVLVAGGGLVYAILRVAMTRQFDGMLRAKAINLSTVAEQRDGELEMDPAEQFFRDFDGDGNQGFFEIWGLDGTELEQSKSLRKGHLPFRYGTMESPEIWNLRLPDGRSGRAMGFKFHPPMEDDDAAEAGSMNAILVVALSREELDQNLDMLGLALLGGTVLIAGLTAFIVPHFLRRELAPLDRLADQARQISIDTLSSRFPASGMPDELMPIVTRLNDLLQRIQSGVERERQFSDDLAHEFRTPIAELRSIAELSLKWPDSRDRQTDESILAIALQMESLINRLLVIARNESRLLQSELKPVDLAAQLEFVLQPMRRKAGENKQSFDVQMKASPVMLGDPVLVRAILTNLLDNAVDHGPEGTVIQVLLFAESDRFVLQCINLAEALTPEDASKMFDRFWRKDTARSGQQHVGLGLALARSMVLGMGCALTSVMRGDKKLVMEFAGKLYSSANHAIAVKSVENTLVKNS